MSIDWETQTYYEILEISPEAQPNEIREAYHRAKSTYSQDNPALYTVFTKNETRQLLSLIEEAYSVLSNQVTREAYDQRIERSSSKKTPSSQHPADDFINQVLSHPETPTSEEHELPNFHFDEESSSDLPMASHQNIRTPSSSPLMKADHETSDVPEGYNKTSLSIYKVDEDMEAQVEAQTVFDGKFLKMVREYKNVNLTRVSEVTRISKAYLNAVESNDYKSLPAPVFVRGFVVQIARILGLDEKKTANSYIQLLKNNH